MVYPVVSDIEGLEVSAEEREFFSKHKPFGFILFGRNCETPEQVKKLTDQIRDMMDDENVPILIDQEGGRVARMRPPHWDMYPSAEFYSKIYDDDPDLAIEAVKMHARLMADDLLKSGVNVDCYPVADILYEGADKVIGDRSYGETAEKVSKLARAAAEAMMEMGVTPIIKHMPGHGRADVDSHLSLPIVDEPIDVLRETDFIPFKEMNDLPCAMSAHVVYSDIDPDYAGTISKKVIGKIIRKELKFKGLLFSDDIGMDALSNSPVGNARDALKAGCDVVLHCNACLDERKDVILGVKELPYKRYKALRSKLVKKVNLEDFDRDKSQSWFMNVMEGASCNV